MRRSGRAPRTSHPSAARSCGSSRTDRSRPDNPFRGSPVWSYGHRNVQGLAFDSAGRLWATEFGQDTWDELNLIVNGRQLRLARRRGRPADARLPRARRSQWHTDDASPSGLAIVDDVAYIAALKGQRLWQVALHGSDVGTPQGLVRGRRTDGCAPSSLRGDRPVAHHVQHRRPRQPRRRGRPDPAASPGLGSRRLMRPITRRVGDDRVTDSPGPTATWASRHAEAARLRWVPFVVARSCASAKASSRRARSAASAATSPRRQPGRRRRQPLGERFVGPRVLGRRTQNSTAIVVVMCSTCSTRSPSASRSVVACSNRPVSSPTGSARDRSPSPASHERPDSSASSARTARTSATTWAGGSGANRTRLPPPPRDPL